MGAPALLLGASTALSTLGALKSGTDEAAAARYNADVATQQGQVAVQEAAAQEMQKRREVSSVLARQRLLIGSSGLSGGTMEDVQADSAQQGEMDALAIRYGGQAAKQRAGAQAVLDKSTARSAASAGLLKGLGVGSSGAYDTYGAYQGWRRPGRIY